MRSSVSTSMYWTMSCRFAAASKMLCVPFPPSSSVTKLCTSASTRCFRSSLRTLSIDLIFCRSASVIVFARIAPSQDIGRVRMLACMLKR